MHFEHIRDIVQHTFLEPGYNLDKKDAVLEPSYICEALGIQGRLDAAGYEQFYRNEIGKSR